MKLNLVKIMDWIVRIFVGALFIFSGLIKINDPVGTQIKLEEYFEVFATDFGNFFHFFIPFALPIAFFLIILEVALGVAVLINFRMKISSWVLLLLILFFTFLTFYSAYFNKVTDCGCFGDAIPLDPWQSFFKDIILTILIIYLFIRRKTLDPLTESKAGSVVVGSAAFITLFLGVWAVRHLPFIDFRPYKVGDNIGVNMQPEEEPVFQYYFRKDGKLIVSDQYLSEKDGFTYESFAIKNPDKSIPKITDFNIWNDELGEYTDQILSGNKLLLLVQNANYASEKNMEYTSTLIQEVRNAGVNVMAVTSSDITSFQNFATKYNIDIPLFFIDATVLKAMIRSNPGLMLLKDGTVMGKWHYNDVPKPDKVLNLL